jgi:hypothetical protein
VAHDLNVRLSHRSHLLRHPEANEIGANQLGERCYSGEIRLASFSGVSQGSQCVER